MDCVPTQAPVSLEFSRARMWFLTSESPGEPWPDIFNQVFHLLDTQCDCQEVCNFLGSVSPQRIWNGRSGVTAPVTAQFYLSAVDITSSRWGAGQPSEKTLIVLVSSFYTFVLPCSWACSSYSQGWPRRGCVFSPEVLTPIHGVSFVPFLQALPFLYL